MCLGEGTYLLKVVLVSVVVFVLEKGGVLVTLFLLDSFFKGFFLVLLLNLENSFFLEGINKFLKFLKVFLLLD